MSRGKKIRSIDACLYFCHNSLYLTIWFSYFLLSLFSLFSLGIFYLPLVTPSSFHPSPIHGYLYPFYTCLNLWDFSLLSLRMYQLLLASFQDYPLACWLPGHYLFLEGACHTTPHFQTKIIVLFSLAHYLASPQQIRVKCSLYLPLWHALNGHSLYLPLLGEMPSQQSIFSKRVSTGTPK